MDWFNDQIKERKIRDSEVFSDSCVEIAGAVMGSRAFVQLNDSRIHVKNSIDKILQYFHIRDDREIPDGITDINDQLEYLMRPYGIMRRTVKLTEGWHKDAIGAMLTLKKDDNGLVALIPAPISGYFYYDADTDETKIVHNSDEKLFDEEAILFYNPFPQRKMELKDLITYMADTISFGDVALVVMATLVVTLVSKLLPKLYNIILDDVIPLQEVWLLGTVAVFLISVTISIALFRTISSLFSKRMKTRLDIAVQSATMMRVLSLPANFFKNYSSGELTSRIGNVNTLCDMLISTVFDSGLTAVFSLVYITDLMAFSPKLTGPAIGILLTTAAFSVISTLVKTNLTRKRMEVSAKESGLSYALISGVRKIKLSGSEKRAFSRWAELYAKEAKLIYDPRTIIKVNSAITLAISLLGTFVLYYQALMNGISSVEYLSFMVSYGMISGAFQGLTGMAQNISQINPVLEMIEPILQEEPEISANKQMVTKLSGLVEFNSVSFRYDTTTPNIIDDMTFKIKPGEYVAFVGKTGCGKSTIVRLMLGFEQADSGVVYYDGKDIDTLDLKSLRRHIGVVMQDGKLFQGDIYSNIVISDPTLTMDDAWEAAELAGIADDIRAMPMGMFTLISEGSGGISGGQRQRILIARAIAPKPKILIFDEATSALDNITQKTVSESLDSLKCTRIVIAHRLSTIKNCDRIMCIDGGKIIESGTYDELVAQGGFFAELVERQRIDTGSSEKEV